MFPSGDEIAGKLPNLCWSWKREEEKPGSGITMEMRHGWTASQRRSETVSSVARRNRNQKKLFPLFSVMIVKSMRFIVKMINDAKRRTTCEIWWAGDCQRRKSVMTTDSHKGPETLNRFIYQTNRLSFPLHHSIAFIVPLINWFLVHRRLRALEI